MGFCFVLYRKSKVKSQKSKVESQKGLYVTSCCHCERNVVERGTRAKRTDEVISLEISTFMKKQFVMQILGIIIIAIVILLAVFLVIYLIRQNRKDQKDLEQFLNNDYKKPKESEFNDGDEEY